MPIHVNIGGVWKDSAMHVNVGGVWKSVAQAHVNISTAWKETLASGWTTTVTLGVLADVYTTGSWWVGYDYLDAYGYDGGADYYSYATNVGSIGDATYTDGSPTTRTVSSVVWSQAGFVVFSLNGTSIPDTDATFVSIDLNGNNYVRSAATYVASKNGGTHWYWAEASNPWGSSSGTYDFGVNI